MAVNRPCRPSWLTATGVVTTCLFGWHCLGVVSSEGKDAPAIVDGTASASPHASIGSMGGKKDAMTELLHWSLENSDPDKVKEVMEKYKDKNLTIKDVYGQDMLDALFVDEGGIMKESISQIADYQNESLSDDDLMGALNRLQEQVEQVDNAGNLHKMGGLRPLLELATSSKRKYKVQTLALWTLGVAVQNNEPVQDDLMSIDGLTQLSEKMPMCNGALPDRSPQKLSPTVESTYCTKLFFAVSALVKNRPEIQMAADRLDVFGELSESLLHYTPMAVTKKALGILETVLAQNPELPFLDRLAARQEEFGDALVGYVHGGQIGGVNLGLAELAVQVIHRILTLRPMLFSQNRQQIQKAGVMAMAKCKKLADDDICRAMSEMLAEIDSMLTAHEVADGDL